MGDNGKVVFRKAEEIMDAYGMTRGAFEEYRKMGMPVRLIHGSWHGHKANIDRFFEKITVVRSVDEEEGIG